MKPILLLLVSMIYCENIWVRVFQKGTSGGYSGPIEFSRDNWCSSDTTFSMNTNGNPQYVLTGGSQGQLNLNGQQLVMCQTGSKWEVLTPASNCQNNVAVRFAFFPFSQSDSHYILYAQYPSDGNWCPVLFSNGNGITTSDWTHLPFLNGGSQDYMKFFVSSNPCNYGITSDSSIAPAPPVPPPPPAPPGPAPPPLKIGLGGSPCSENHFCQPGFCCNSVVCARCPSGPPPKSTSPTPPKPTPPPAPIKEGNFCTQNLPCQQGLCCLPAPNSVVKLNKCQKCPSSTPPKPTPPKPSTGSCDGKTGKGCKFVDCANDADCPSGMTCVAPEESGDSKVCYPTQSELGTERKLLGGSVGSYTESDATGNMNQFAAYDFAQKFAFAVYSSNNKAVSNGLCKTYKLVKYFESRPLFIAFGIYQSDNHVVVAIRGTVNDLRGVGNWLANLNILPTSFSSGNVATGFLVAYQSIDHEIINQLDAMKFSSITITGHSLGGALSQLLVVDLLSRSASKYKIDSHITFGMPHVGDEAFQNDYEQKMGSKMKAHFVAQSPKGRIDFVTEVSPTFSPIPGKLTLPVKRLGYISLHSGYPATFEEWESKHLKSSGKCVNFNSASSSAPPPGPSHGPQTPPSPSKSDGPACSVKFTSSNDLTDLIIDPKQVISQIKPFMSKNMACSKKVHKRAFDTFCGLTLQGITPEIRDKIINTAARIRYDINYLKGLVQSKNDAQLLLHNQENIDLLDHYATLSDQDGSLFLQAYSFVHDRGGDGDSTVSFKTIQAKAEQKIQHAKQIVSSIKGNSRVTSKAIQEEFLVAFHSTFLNDIRGHLSALQTKANSDPKTKQQALVTVLNPNSVGSHINKIMDLFLTARNTIFAALNNLSKPKFKIPKQKLIDISHPEVKNAVIQILTRMIAPGTEHTFAYFDTNGILNGKRSKAEAVGGSGVGSTISFNANYFFSGGTDDEDFIHTIIHEMSHTLVSTQDIAYRENCQNLFPYSGNVATYRALQNADTIAYFVAAAAQDSSNSCKIS